MHSYKIFSIDIFFQGKSLSYFIKNEFDISFISALHWIESKDILLNNKKAKPSDKLKITDKIYISSFFLERKIFTPVDKKNDINKKNTQKYNFYLHNLKKNILYNDDKIICLNKPYGLASQAGSGVDFCVQDFFDELSNSELKIIHRLDIETSGIFVLAKTSQVAAQIFELFNQRLVKKKYIAIVSNFTAKKDFFTVNMPIQVDNKIKDAKTDFKIITKQDNYFVLEAYPLTGRKHQIRKHLYEMQMPIIGDKKYFGNMKISKKLQLFASEMIIPGFLDIKLDIKTIEHCILNK